MKKFLTTLAMLTVFATPVFAQSFDPDNGTGNLLPFAYAPQANGSDNDAFAKSAAKSAHLHQSAKSAFAQAPVATAGPAGLAYQRTVPSFTASSGYLSRPCGTVTTSPGGNVVS
jgi:hypothetical protein